jgi:hypothetical protein
MQKALGGRAEALIGRRRLVDHENGVGAAAVEASRQGRQRLGQQAPGGMDDAWRFLHERRRQAKTGGELHRLGLVDELEIGGIARVAAGQALADRLRGAVGGGHHHLPYAGRLERVEDVVRDGLIGDVVGRRDRLGLSPVPDGVLDNHNTPKLHT